MVIYKIYICIGLHTYILTCQSYVNVGGGYLCARKSLKQLINEFYFIQLEITLKNL